MESDREFIAWARDRYGALTWQERDRLFTLAARGAATHWRPIEEAPRDGKRVLLTYLNTAQKRRRVIAFYAPKLAIENQNSEFDGWLDYDEAGDRYCLPEGWYECIENWDDYSYVHMSGVEPTHFIPLSALGEPE